MVKHCFVLVKSTIVVVQPTMVLVQPTMVVVQPTMVVVQLTTVHQHRHHSSIPPTPRHTLVEAPTNRHPSSPLLCTSTLLCCTSTPFLLLPLSLC